jgi:hypothetical protein
MGASIFLYIKRGTSRCEKISILIFKCVDSTGPRSVVDFCDRCSTSRSYIRARDNEWAENPDHLPLTTLPLDISKEKIYISRIILFVDTFKRSFERKEARPFMRHTPLRAFLASNRLHVTSHKISPPSNYCVVMTDET